MKVGRQSKLRVLVITLIFGLMMGLAQPRQADAYYGGGEAGLVMLYVMFLSTASVVCAPVAAVSSAASDKEFDEAYGNCFLPVLWLGEPPPAEDEEVFPEPTSTLDGPTEEEDEGRE